MIAFIYTTETPAGAPSPVDALLRVRRWLARVAVDAAIVAVGSGDAMAEWPEAETVPAVPDGGVATALRRSLEGLGADPFLVIDAERFVEFDLEELVAEHASSPAIATLLLRPTGGRSDERRAEVDRTGRILRLAPGEVAPELGLMTTGTAVVEPDLLQHVLVDRVSGLEEDLFPFVLRHRGILSAWKVSDGEDAPRRRPTVGVGS